MDGGFPFRETGRLLVILAAVAAIVGAALLWHDRLPWLGRLPGDLVFRRGGLTVYAPIATSVVLSLVLTVLLWLVLRK